MIQSVATMRFKHCSASFVALAINMTSYVTEQTHQFVCRLVLQWAQFKYPCHPNPTHSPPVGLDMLTQPMLNQLSPPTSSCSSPPTRNSSLPICSPGDFFWGLASINIPECIPSKSHIDDPLLISHLLRFTFHFYPEPYALKFQSVHTLRIPEWQ